MDSSILLILFLLFLILLFFLSSKANQKILKVKKFEIDKSYNLKNKETFCLVKKHNLKNMQIWFLDNLISKLKSNKNLVLQNSEWKIVPNKLMFYVPHSFLKVNQFIYSIIANNFNMIEFVSDVNFAKNRYIAELKNFSHFIINNIYITKLVTTNKTTYAVLNSQVYVSIFNEINSKFLHLVLENKSNDECFFGIYLKLKNFDYYSINKKANETILSGEINKDKYRIIAPKNIEVSTNGLALVLTTKANKNETIKIKITKQQSLLLDFEADESIINRYYSYLNLNALNLKGCANYVYDFLSKLGIVINKSFIQINKIVLTKNFWFSFNGIKFKFIKEMNNSDIAFVVNNRKVLGARKFKLNLIQNNELTIIY